MGIIVWIAAVCSSDDPVPERDSAPPQAYAYRGSAHILDNFFGKVLEIASGASSSVGERRASTPQVAGSVLPGAPVYLSFKISITKVKSHVEPLIGSNSYTPRYLSS